MSYDPLPYSQHVSKKVEWTLVKGGEFSISLSSARPLLANPWKSLCANCGQPTVVKRRNNLKLVLVARRFIILVRNVKWSTGKEIIKLTARVIG